MVPPEVNATTTDILGLISSSTPPNYGNITALNSYITTPALAGWGARILARHDPSGRAPTSASSQASGQAPYPGTPQGRGASH